MSAVESPTHYTQGYLEVIYVIEQVLGKDGFKAFCLGNWLKYKTRHEHKNGTEDLAKAEQYLAWANNGLPAPVNGRVPRAKEESAKPALSGSISALLQHELDVLVPNVWHVRSVSTLPVGGGFQVSATVECRLDNVLVRGTLQHVAHAAHYAEVVYDLIDEFKKHRPEGPWRSV